MDLIKVHLNEVSELEPLVISSMEKIEVGLKPLEHQLSIGTSGRPDILAVDRNGTLILFELKSTTADTSAIGQCVRYYEWFVKNLALVARPFPTLKPDKGIRLFIIAPDFDEDTIRIAKYLRVDLDISLIKYISLKNKKTSEVGLVFEILELERVEGPGVQFRSQEDIISYFADKSLIDEFQKVLKDLDKVGIKCHPYQGGKDYWIECVFEGEEVAYLQPRQKYFNCQVYDESAEKFIWPPLRMESYNQWVKECRDKIIKYTKKADGD